MLGKMWKEWRSSKAQVFLVTILIRTVPTKTLGFAYKCSVRAGNNGTRLDISRSLIKIIWDYREVCRYITSSHSKTDFKWIVVRNNNITAKMMYNLMT